MGICCCCEEEPPLRVPNHADFRRRRQSQERAQPGDYRFFGTGTQTEAFSRPLSSGAAQERQNAQTSARAMCQFCGNFFDTSLLDGHQETCRANLRKKASEMRTAEGQVVNLRVFELDPDVEYEDDQVCVVCMSAMRSYAIIPCGHLIACGLCAKQLETCPMCRKDRQGLLFVDPTAELKTTCKSCKNVIHPAYFDGHREVCALQMRQLAAELARLAEAERERDKDGRSPEGDGHTLVTIVGDRRSSDGTCYAGVSCNSGDNDAMKGRRGSSVPPSLALEPASEGETAPLINRPASDQGPAPKAAMGVDAGGNRNRSNDEYSERESENGRGTAESREPAHATRSPGIDYPKNGNSNAVSPLVKPSESLGLARAQQSPGKSALSPSLQTANTHSSSPPPLLLQNMCIECRKAPTEVAFIPCGHSNMCGACAEKVTVCPVCLTPIRSTMHTFK